MSGSDYERELRDILEGNPEDHIKSLSEDKKEIYREMEDQPFSIVRGAGSLGIDLVAMRDMIYLPIEVKSSKDETIYFSDDPRLQEQVDDLIEESKRTNIPVAFARRKKGIRGERWEMFRIRSPSSEKKLWFLPTIPKTKKGSWKLPWGEGLELSSFIHLINPSQKLLDIKEEK